MGIVGGFDIHRRQITVDYLDTDTGETIRGKIAPADRQQLRSWLGRFHGRTGVVFALEGCTGWRFVVEEARAGGGRGPSGRAGRHRQGAGPQATGQDRRDRCPPPARTAEHGPAARVLDPPDHVLEVRARVRLYKALADERRGWMQRIRATLFHQGVPTLACHLLAADVRIPAVSVHRFRSNPYTDSDRIRTPRWGGRRSAGVR